MNIWFIITNSSHLDKNMALLRSLQDHGHQIHLACTDAVQDPIHHSLEKIRKSGFPYKVVYAPGFPREGRTAVRMLYTHRLRRGLRKFLDSCGHIDVMVFGADTGIVSRTFVRMAVERKIPSVLIADGLNMPKIPQPRGGLRDACLKARLMIIKCLRWCFYRSGPRGTSGVDLILTVGRVCTDALLSQLRMTNIKPVGSPEYEELARRLSKENPAAMSRNVRDRLGLDDRPVVFFAHQSLGVSQEDELSRIASMAKGAHRGGGFLLVKFHPRGKEDPAEWQKLTESVGLSRQDVRFVRRECTSIECCVLCEVCVTVFSTVAVEAMVCGKPIVAIQYGERPQTFAYGKKYGSAYDVYNDQQLEDAVAEILTNDDTRGRIIKAVGVALEEEMFGLDGMSAERTEAAIEQLVRQRTGAKAVRG